MNKKLNQEIIKQLQSGEISKTNNAVSWLRNDGDINYLPIIFDVMNQGDGKDVIHVLEAFLADIKNDGAVPVFIAALQDPKYQQILPFLISACWQSGLDFSSHSHLFSKLFITEDFVVGVEVYSAFLNMVDNLSQEDTEIVSMEIKKGIPEMVEIKQKLAFQILDLF